MTAKVLIIVGDASETVDTLYPYYRLIEGGYEPVVAGPQRRLFQMVMHEVKPGWSITKEWEGYSIMADIAFSEIDPVEYAGIVQGLRMATVAKCKFDLEVCGGIYVNEPCVIDQHMFSGRTYHDHGHYIGPWIRALDVFTGKQVH
jgi:protease I